MPFWLTPFLPLIGGACFPQKSGSPTATNFLYGSLFPSSCGAEYANLYLDYLRFSVELIQNIRVRFNLPQLIVELFVCLPFLMRRRKPLGLGQPLAWGEEGLCRTDFDLFEFDLYGLIFGAGPCPCLCELVVLVNEVGVLPLEVVVIEPEFVDFGLLHQYFFF